MGPAGLEGERALQWMESKSYRTTSDVIVIYEANDTEGTREETGALLFSLVS